MRGQFIRGDGLILPNNISLAGAEMLLTAALRNTVPTLYAGLVVGMPNADMTFGSVVEPTIGTHGYARIAITRDAIGWPTLGVTGNEKYIQTDWLLWAASGGDFDQDIQRVALCGTNIYDSDDVIYALSAPLPEPITITPTTAENERKFKYAIYL